MRHASARRWIFTTALFAAINVAQIVGIMLVLRQPRPTLTIESFRSGRTGGDQDISVRFSQAMVTPDRIGKAGKRGLITIMPPVWGDPIWKDVRTLVFRPKERLKQATRYTVTVSGEIVSLPGESLAEDWVHYFATGALELESIWQMGFSADQRLSFALHFNDDVDPRHLEKRLTLRTGVGRLNYAVETRAPARTISVTTVPLEGSVVYAVLSEGMRGLSGPLGLEEEIRRTMKINNDLTISRTHARTNTAGHSWVRVRSTQRIDPLSAADGITVDPHVDFKVIRTYHGIELSGRFIPGKRYRIKFLKGLRAEEGAILKEDTVRSVVIPDIPPTLRFKTRGIYLSALGNKLLPLEAINIDDADVTIEEVYPNNLIYFMRDTGRYNRPRDLAHTVAEKHCTFTGPANEARVVHLDLEQLLGGAPGLYSVTARHTKKSWKRARTLVLLTDLGITAKKSKSDLLVWVNSLASARPAAGVTVAAYTVTNQKIAEKLTDECGIAHFTNVDWSGDRKPFAVTASRQSAADRRPDVAFIHLDRTALDTSSLDVAGRPYRREHYDAFVYTDRGIYRPGDTVHLHGIIRDPSGPSGLPFDLPGAFPVELAVTRPDGRPFRTFKLTLSAWGSVDATLPLPAYAPTGRYTAELRVPGGKSAMGRVAFRVEEFVPDRMKVKISAEQRRFKAGDEIAFTVAAKHLFGAPASDRTVEARCEFVSSTFTHPDWPDYCFIDDGKTFATVRESLGEATLDDDGKKTFTVKVPEKLTPPSALTLVFTATVKEVGGRSVTTSLSREVDILPSYVGLARHSSTHAVPGQAERFSCVAITPDGAPAAAAALEAIFYKIDWNTVLKLDDNGRYRYESVREAHEIERIAFSVRDGRGSVSFTPQKAGRYEVRIRDGKSGASADITFYCSGGSANQWSMEKPEKLELIPDKERYKPGETARVLIKSPLAGQALITIESDRVHSARVVTLETNTKEISIPIDASFGPNAYCTVTVIRPVDPQHRWAVHRAYGAVPLLVDNEPRRLQVELTAPEETRPNGHLRLRIAVRDAAGNPTQAEVTVAAVDEGICSLTRFESPDPWKFFFAKRCLEVTTSDVYSLLMPEVGKRKVGSDSEEGGGKEPGSYDPRLLNPVAVRRIKSVALWKSNIVTGEDGRVDVTFDIPEIFGQLRLMVVAATPADFGMAQQALYVRQPLMITPSFPRFLAPGDEFIVPVTITNNTGRGGTVQLNVDCTGSLKLLRDAPAPIMIEHGREATVELPMQAPDAPGRVSATITASLGDEQATSTVEMAVRPPTTLTHLSGTGTIRAGTSRRIEIPGGWLPQTATYRLSFSSLPMLKFGRSLRYLVRYPYGCVEQTTSAAFPLLYLADVAEIVDPETFHNTAPQDFAQAGIDRLLAMQTRSGGMAMWPGGGAPYKWASIYTCHFLVEAKRAGYDVPEHALDSVLGYLDNSLLRTSAHNDSLTRQAYACFVLAAAGRPNRSWTNRLYEERDRLPLYSRFHVAAALARMKQHALAATIVREAELPKMTQQRDTAGVLHSSMREAAILLSVYMDIDPEHVNVLPLVKRLEMGMKDGRWATTQENGFALLALGKYIRHLKKEKPAYQADVSVRGKRLAQFTHDDNVVIEPDNLGGESVDVNVRGKGVLCYQWVAEGIPAEGKVQETDNHLKVRRRFLSRGGNQLDTQAILHGEIVIVEITLESSRRLDNLVINDLLPAGFEIENPRLATRDALPWLANSSFTPQRIEMRDDRLVIFADLSAGKHVYRYVVRAVTRGRFRLPPITAFCMYDPEIASAHGAGTVAVDNAL